MSRTLDVKDLPEGRELKMMINKELNYTNHAARNNDYYNTTNAHRRVYRALWRGRVVQRLDRSLSDRGTGVRTERLSERRLRVAVLGKLLTSGVS
jgi:hypothetical protein